MPKEPKVTVRFPEKLYTEVSISAETNRRSMNAECLILIEKGLADDRRADKNASRRS